ncbi:MAG: DNA replication/repair protein RecF [Syntrophomonadaceae bacterium]|nr:DNA replication/repair protein RecF [Syntrophomonadaceae bacterium]
MKLRQVEARDFRNIARLDYQPGPGLNILLGANAQGKTNILESIYVLSTGSSFRVGQDKNMVQYEKENFIVRGRYNYNDRDIETVLRYNLKEGKNLTLNSKKTSFNNNDRLRVVLFTPDDLYLIKGSPGKRRQFLDFILGQIKSEYGYNLTNYVKILKKRNLLLKREQSNTSSFKIIEEVFIENAARVILARINLISILDESSSSIYQEISNEGQLKTRYALSFPVDSGKINLDILKGALKKQIQEKAEQEIRRRSSLVGPHLDDMHIYQDGRMARYFASQGQQRNIAVALKLAELYTFRKISGFYPVFLLDEVLSELDAQKRQLLLDHLQEAEFQSFLTSVHLNDIEYSRAAVSVVEKGELQ